MLRLLHFLPFFVSQIASDTLMQDLKEVSGVTVQTTRYYSTQPKLRNCLFVEVTSVSGLTKLCLRKKQVQCVPRRHLLLSSQIRREDFRWDWSYCSIWFEKIVILFSKYLSLKKRASASLFLTQKSKEMLLSFHFTHIKILVLKYFIQ